MLEFSFFIVGLLFGSFANVCILRLPKDKDIFFLKSKCFNCEKEILWKNNIPLLSYLNLAGISECCKKKISLQYPIIELTMALLFLINSILFETSQAFVMSIIFFILLLIIVIDFYERIIFDFMNYFLIISGISVSIINPKLNPENITILNSAVTCIVSFVFFYFLKELFKKKKNIEALGMGDVYLIAGLGAWLGFEKFCYILSISSIIGILYYLFRGNNDKNFEIPYGSALGVSFILLVYSDNFLHIIT